MQYHALSYALPPGMSFTVGEFHYDVASEIWQWSEGTFAIHGFKPGDVVPTTLLVLTHKHPEDRGDFEALFHCVLTEGGTIVSHHRIIDGNGATRRVVMIAEAVKDTDGSIATVKGHYLDLSAVMNAEAFMVADEAVTRATEKRQFIEQAKGLLMCRFQIDSETPFAMLAQRSQRDQRKLRTVAEELIDSFDKVLANHRTSTAS